MIFNRLKEARKSKGLTQSELADAIGVRRALISKYESGKISPTVSRLQQLAKALDVTLDYLLGWEGEAKTALGKAIKAPLGKGIKVYEDNNFGHMVTQTENLSADEFNEFSIFIGKMGYYITLDDEGYCIADNNSDKRKRISVEELKTLVRTSNNVVKSLIDSLMSDL